MLFYVEVLEWGFSYEPNKMLRKGSLLSIHFSILKLIFGCEMVIKLKKQSMSSSQHVLGDTIQMKRTFHIFINRNYF